MTIARSHSFFLAVGILIVFFAGSIWFLRQSSSRVDTEKTAAVQISDITPSTDSALKSSGSIPADSKLALKEFFRSETKDGKKMWEVKAAKGNYFPETNTATLEDAKLWVFEQEGKEPFELVAKAATLYLEAGGLTKAEASEGVILTQGERVKIETDNATYFKTEGRISAPGFVKVTTKRLMISGEGLDAQLEPQIFSLKSNVDTVVNAKERE